MVYTIVVHCEAKDLEPETINKIENKLKEASDIYSKDRGTVQWLVMKDVLQPGKYSIVERFEDEGSQKWHLENPFWKTFDPFMLPLLKDGFHLSRHEELSGPFEVFK